MFFRFFLSLLFLLCGYNSLYASHEPVHISAVQNLAEKAGIATFKAYTNHSNTTHFSPEHRYRNKIIAENEAEEEETYQLNKTVATNTLPHVLSTSTQIPYPNIFFVAPLLTEISFHYPPSFRCILLGVFRI